MPNERPRKFFEDSIVVLILGPSEVSVAIGLDLFWVVFHVMLSQIWSNLYKKFTGDAMQGNLRFLL